MNSLWGEEFNIKNTQTEAKKILSKMKEPKQPKVIQSKALNKLSIEEQIKIIKENVDTTLHIYKDTVTVLTSTQDLHFYIDKAIMNGVIALDTETDHSLDPLTCTLMGVCLYTPGLNSKELGKSAYIPVNHWDYKTHERYNWQCTEADIKRELDRLVYNGVKIIYHNADFDYRVIHCTCNCDLTIDWDTMVGARVLNENERASLKGQYAAKIDPSVEKYSVDTFFKDVDYRDVPVDTFAVYAATDAYITYKLYQYQIQEFNRPENKGLLELMQKVEIPILPVVAKMELTGIKIDKKYAKTLSDLYHKQAEEADSTINQELIKLRPIINKWKESPEAHERTINKKGEVAKKEKVDQLEDPIALTSTTQLAILMYDILKYPAVDKNNPRGTGEDIIEKISAKYDFPLGKAILAKRGIEKLLGTYLDKIPAETHADDRIRASINPLGADTGRFAISNPSLQNIPSEHKEVRLMFEASPGYVIVGGDYSQQEPRLLAALSGDTSMINAYVTGKDLYSTVAALVYNNNYEDNKEFHPDGTLNPDGKKRRSNCKSIVLGLLYGRGTASVAEQIGSSVSEAQELVDKFFNAFPTVRDWIEANKNQARTHGYVQGIVGRRRRLPDIQLPKYVLTAKTSLLSKEFNPLLNTSGLHPSDELNKKQSYYEQELLKATTLKQKNQVKKLAEQDGFKVQDNSGFIAQAERQSTNAIIQGSAATLTKLAMIDIDRDETLRQLGFRTLLCIHDEVMGECPKENADQVGIRLAQLMIDAAKPVCTVPMKCDVYKVERWYLDEISGNVKGKYDKNPCQETREHLYQEYPYINKEAIDSMIDDTIDLMNAEIHI